MFRIIFPDEEIVLNSSPSIQLEFSENELKQLPFLVAANTWINFRDDLKQEFLASYIEGLKDSDKGNEKILPYPFKYERLKALIALKDNLDLSNTVFDQLSKDPGYIPIYPKNLYYKIIKEGKGLPLANQTKTTLHFTIKKFDDELLADTWGRGVPTFINLTETIPGFAWGIKGMKKGEIREIFIHPSLAYGIYTTLDKGIYLKAYVQLIDFDSNENDEKEFPKLDLLDLKVGLASTLNSDYIEESKKYGYESGYRLWQHYKKSNFYALSQILEYFNQFQAGLDPEPILQNGQDLINRLHWNIYNLKVND